MMGSTKAAVLPGTGLGDTDHVFAGQNKGDGLRLNGGGSGKIEGIDAVQQVGMETEFRKIQVK